MTGRAANAAPRAAHDGGDLVLRHLVTLVEDALASRGLLHLVPGHLPAKAFAQGFAALVAFHTGGVRRVLCAQGVAQINSPLFTCLLILLVRLVEPDHLHEVEALREPPVRSFRGFELLPSKDTDEEREQAFPARR
jgi:hypothetical protein